MRLELLGAIGLTTLFAVACGGEDNNTDLGNGAGGSAAGAGGDVTGNGGSVTGNGGVSNGGFGNGNGGVSNGGFGNGNGGNQNAGGAQNGAGGTGTLTCPTTQPNDGDACNARGSCTYGSMLCACRRTGGGTARTFTCFDVPDGGFTPPPRPDGGVVGGDGGFTPPPTCTQASDCTAGGNVCCQLRRASVCISAANGTQFGGTPLP